MRIDNLEIENFKNYKSLHIDFAEGINLLVGNNGSGKTSILEAINIAVGGFFAEQESKMRRAIEISEIKLTNGKREPFSSIKANSGLINGNWSRTIKRDTKSNDNKYTNPASEYGNSFMEAFDQENNRSVAPLIAYYSTKRLFRDASQSAKQKYDAAVGRRNGYLQSLKENAIKGTLNEWLGNAVTRRATKQIKEIEQQDLILENVESAIRKTLITFLELDSDFPLKIYQEPDFDFELFINYDDEHDLPLSYYSDGFRNIIYLIIDMVWRSSQLNPWLNLDELADQVFGVVTIDEIDLHLHPKWQAKTISLIQAFFPKVQFFITTHSPTVVANFKERLNGHGDKIDTLFILENNNYTRVETSFYGKDVNSVLENPLDAKTRAEEVDHLMIEFKRISENPESTEADYHELKNIAVSLNEFLPGSNTEIIRVNEIIERLNNSVQ